MAKNLSERQNTMLGMTAAFVEAIILQPTLYWKNARARGLPFTLSPATIYRGTGASILNEMQMMGCQFFLTSSLQKHVFAGVGPSEEYLSAGVGGMLSAFISSPIELVMIQQQVYGQSFPRTVLSIARNNGVFSRTGLLRGLGPTICRDGIYVCGMLGITPVVDGYLQREHGCSPAASSFYASMIGGVCATIPSQPFDVVKTVLQGDRVQEQRHASVARTPAMVLTGLLREGGLGRLAAGLGWRTVNICGTIYVANECRVRLSPYFATL